jgi:hypothetical protein
MLNVKSPIIKNLAPGLTEIGKIKIGKKGDTRQSSQGGTYQMPVRLDHFLITTLERGKDGNFVVDEELHKKLGGVNLKRIPVQLMFNDIGMNFQSRYSCYTGKTLWCSGDGESASRLTPEGARENVPCCCGRQEPTYKGKDKCKINGSLSVIIDGADRIGGVWKFRTTGYNSTVGIMSSLMMIKTLTGGILCGLPLEMTIQPKIATQPDGTSTTIQVVGITFRGDMQKLQQESLKIASQHAEHCLRVENIENEVRKLISVDAELIDQAGDIVEEFYPEEQQAPVLAEPAPIQEPAPIPEPAPEPKPKRTNKKKEIEQEPEEIPSLSNDNEDDVNLF